MTKPADDILTQIHLALGKGYRAAAIIGALTGGGVTYCTHAMARGDLATTPWESGHYAWFLGRLALVLGGLLFSILTTYSFGRSAFGSGWLAVGFLVLMDGVMVASAQPQLEWFATVLLIAIEAVTTGCTVARGRMTTLERQAEQAAAAVGSRTMYHSVSSARSYRTKSATTIQKSPKSQSRPALTLVS